MVSCDIVIPVFNALDDLKACVDSVFENTGGDYNLILIDDKSTEPGISEYLSWLEKKRLNNVKVKRNETNRGFVKTVNRGMRESANDVVLLNSDTIVTKGWLGKMAACAYSNNAIASVTPLTNSGTICSVPNFCEDNALPEEITPQVMSDIIEGISMRLYPEIPTGVGFCMYIKRKALNEAGYFDEETFGRGYGEENDWCCRAAELGYSHVLDDATFIYHKGAMSFKGDKAALIEKNLALLLNKHPHYFEMVDRFIAENPLHDIQENIKAHVGFASTPNKILVALSSKEDMSRISDIAGEFESRDVYAFWLENGRRLLFTKALPESADKLEFHLNSPVLFPSFIHQEYRNLIHKILNTFRIDGLVIEGLVGHSPEMLNAARLAGVKVISRAESRKDTGSTWAPASIKKMWLNSFSTPVPDIETSDAPGIKLPVLTWDEIKAARKRGSTEIPDRYTQKQKEAFDYLVVLANRNRKPLKLAKFLFYLLNGKSSKI